MLLCCRQIRQSVRVHCFSDGGRAPSTSRRLWSEWTAALCPGNSRPAGGGRTAGRQADSFWRPRRFICHNVSLDGDTVGGRRRERALLAHYDRPRWPWSVIDVAAWRESVTLAAEHSVTHLIAADPPPPPAFRLSSKHCTHAIVVHATKVFTHATLCQRGLCRRNMSVRLSVTRRYCI